MGSGRAGLCLTVILHCLCPGLLAQGPRNVVLILGDDAGVQMGAYKDSAIQTPHLDALAARSVVFTNAYTSVSSDSPSRSVLLTGLPQHQNGMYGLANGVSHFSSFDNVASLPLILANHSIRTGIIGKKHLKPDHVYKFDFEATEEQYDLDQIGRNITLIKQLVHNFLAVRDSRPFFLYLSFRDPHRCEVGGKYGDFCERLGNGQPGFGLMPDWKPVHYDPNNVTVPYFLPNSAATRRELANMYTAVSRLDQGVGLLLKELEAAGVEDNTLVLFTSDEGVPFPNAKTNLYEAGTRLPLLLSSPLHRQHWGNRTAALASSTDILPTVLDWFSLSHPSLSLKLTGRSLLPLTADPANVTAFARVFSSHNLNDVTMYYPMRSLRTPRYRLIHNLNYRSAFAMAVDVGTSPTFQDILNNTNYFLPTGWFKSLSQYYFREQYELFDLDIDPHELDNAAGDPAHSAIFDSLRSELKAWQEVTHDPWRCLPEDFLSPQGQCMSSGNTLP